MKKIEGSIALFEAMLNRQFTDDDILVVPPRYMTAYDPLKHGLYAYDPNAGAISLWDRVLPDAALPSPAGYNREGVGLGIDAGGTYTDAVIYDFTSSKVIAKAKAPYYKMEFYSWNN